LFRTGFHFFTLSFECLHADTFVARRFIKILQEEVLPLVRLLICEHASSDGRKVTEAALLRSDAFGKVLHMCTTNFRANVALIQCLLPFLKLTTAWPLA
jgi:hypothetical protein